MKNTKKNQEKWIHLIQTNLKLRGRSEKTFINYKCALNCFFKYYDENTNFKNLSEEQIVPYLNDTFIKTNRSKNSYNLSVASIRLFYLVCMRKTLSNILLPTSNTPNKLPVILSKNTFIKIFNEEHYLKYKCWLILAFCSGLRVEEVASVKIENIFPSEHKLKVLGKGNKERYTILPDIVIKFLRLYCKEQHITQKQGYLFKGTKGNEYINSKCIVNYFSSLKATYNLDKNITFHSLRHSFATFYLMNGGSLLALQSMLGHKSLNTTTIYLHLSQNFKQLEGIKYV